MNYTDPSLKELEGTQVEDSQGVGDINVIRKTKIGKMPLLAFAWRCCHVAPVVSAVTLT